MRAARWRCPANRRNHPSPAMSPSVLSPPRTTDLRSSNGPVKGRRVSAREQVDRKPAPADKRSTARSGVPPQPDARSRPAELLALQHTVGNRAVQRLLAATPLDARVIRRLVDRKKIEAS